MSYSQGRKIGQYTRKSASCLSKPPGASFCSPQTFGNKENPPTILSCLIASLGFFLLPSQESWCLILTRKTLKRPLVSILLGASLAQTSWLLGQRLLPFTGGVRAWGEGFSEECPKLVQVGLVGFRAEGKDPVRAMGSPIAPILKDETGVVSLEMAL